jgi:hypothetical protein
MGETISSFFSMELPISSEMRDEINDGWHISIARHLQIFVGNTNMIGTASKAKYAVAYDLIFAVRNTLRIPVLKQGLTDYQDTINGLLSTLIDICEPSTKSLCNFIKFHWPRHWSDTRLQLGCAAAEKSLERKLGEIQKRNFAFTNARHNVSVSYARQNVHCDVHYDVLWDVHIDVH